MPTVAPTGTHRYVAAHLPSRHRRLLEGLAFVAVWVTAGYLLPLDTEATCSSGIPLTAASRRWCAAARCVSCWPAARHRQCWPGRPRHSDGGACWSSPPGMTGRKAARRTAA